MAWELHYTSARAGQSGRAGFRFVARTPGTPPGLETSVAPYLAYRPPPHAPLSPDADELAGFPVTLAYDRIGDQALLVRCRYLGKDYSGRFGNFFAQVLVAGPEELEGLRPVELWCSPVWTALPGEGDLPELDDLPPGGDLVPDTLAGWLADISAYDVLARLVNAVVTVLGRGHGRVVLVCEDAGLVARWLAAVSFSLPTELAARMSFTTYSADPDGGPYRVVGTTPDVRDSMTHDDTAFVLDLTGAPWGAVRGAAPPARPWPGAGRFARTVAACWKGYDFAGLDALGELALIGLPAGGGPSAAAPVGSPEAVFPPPVEPGSEAGTRAAAPTGDDVRDKADTGGGATTAAAGAEQVNGAERAGGPEEAFGPEQAGDPEHAPGPDRTGAARPAGTRPPFGAAGGPPEPGPARPLGATLDRAAGLFALCRHEPDVTVEEEVEIAELLTRGGGAVPDWVWHELVPALPRIGFDLATALCSWARRTGMAELADRCAHRCVTLALADPALRPVLFQRLAEITLPVPLLAELGPEISRALAAAPELTEVARVVALASRIGAAVPGREVAMAAAGCARRGEADLPAALDSAPQAWWPALAAGTVAGLEASDPHTRSAVLTPRACDRLGASRDWSRFPLTGLEVLRSIGHRHHGRRLDVTRALIEISPALAAAAPATTAPTAAMGTATATASASATADRAGGLGAGTGTGDPVAAALGEVWSEVPTPGECLELVKTAGPALRHHPVLCGVPARVFAAAADADRLATPEILRLAEHLVRVAAADARAAAAGEPSVENPAASAPSTPSATSAASAVPATSATGANTAHTGHPAPPWIAAANADAALVTAAALASDDRTPVKVAGHLDRMARLGRYTTPGLAGRVTAFAARRLAGASPRFRADVLAVCSPGTRGRLVARWIETLPQGPLQSRAERHELMVVAILLRERGAGEPALERWARSLAGRRLGRLQLEAYLRDRPELRAGLRAFAAEARSAPDPADRPGDPGHPSSPSSPSSPSGPSGPSGPGHPNDPGDPAGRGT